VPVITFGPFAFESSPPRLLRDELEVTLRPQALKALGVLARQRGHFVGHERLITEAWDGNIVSRHTVDVTVGEVRRSLGDHAAWIRQRPKIGYCLAVPRSDEAIRRAQLFSSLRTREGFDRALECFDRAAHEDPSDFRAYEGKSACYLMLMSHGMRLPSDMYERFLDAHDRAVALVGLTPELRCSRAHGWHLFERRPADAAAELQSVLEEAPRLTSACVRLALAYATLQRLDDALETVRRAYAVDPLVPLLPVIDLCIRFWRREYDEAVAIGSQAIELHPFLQFGRAFYAQALECAGRLNEALTQYEIGAVLSPGLPWLRALHGACLAKCGRMDEAGSMLEGLERVRAREYVDAYSMAVLREALGQRDEAFAELTRAVDERSAGLVAIELDPKMDAIRSDPRFSQLVARCAFAAVASRGPLGSRLFGPEAGDPLTEAWSGAARATGQADF
jgi:DNA-binding winged helix-turn-helix (wHTH) protein